MYKYSGMFYKNAQDDLVALVKTALGESTPLTTKQQRSILEQRQEALRWQERDLLLRLEQIANHIETLRAQQDVLQEKQDALRQEEEQQKQLQRCNSSKKYAGQERLEKEQAQQLTSLMKMLDIAKPKNATAGILTKPLTSLYKKYNLSEAKFAQRLRRHLMRPGMLQKYGYPMESWQEKWSATIYMDFLPRRQRLERSLCPVAWNGVKQRLCVRCFYPFYIKESGEYKTKTGCVYHWGKLKNDKYTCCGDERGSEGCTYHKLHVWNGVTCGDNGPYNDFIFTSIKPSSVKTGKTTKVYALDCEMCYTVYGLELTKISLVGFNGQVVYDHYVRPKAKVVDYCTRFSGVKPSDLCPVHNQNLKTLAEVQRDLLQFIDADTILIGHSLENDLRVLRMVHTKIVDTAYEFPHPNGFPYRHSLKNLAKKYLKRDIQCSEEGHDSAEDALACLDLVMWKVRHNIPPKRPCRQINFD